MEFADEEILLYDLSNRPASFDFVTCLSTAIGYGIKHVRFVLDRGWKVKNYSNAPERFRSIVEPAVALFGLTYSIGERRGVELSHFFPACVDIYQRTGKIGKIITPCVRGDYVTVTMRNSRTKPRNSKGREWDAFRERCDRECILIPDYEDRPISLEDRMKLYAGAYMNLMVINGPVTLCIHSDAPYICMKTIGDENCFSTAPSFMKKIGITPGFQFPWAKEHQLLSYLDDTAENIWTEYSRFTEQRMAA